MAESKKTTDTSEKKVKIFLRRNPDRNAPQEEFYSYNFRNFLIKRGVEVEVPEGLAQLIMDNEEAATKAYEYSQEKALKES